MSTFSSVWFSRKRTASFTKAAAGLAVVVNGITVHEKSGIFSFNVVQNDRIMCKPITTCKARTTNIFIDQIHFLMGEDLF